MKIQSPIGAPSTPRTVESTQECHPAIARKASSRHDGSGAGAADEPERQRGEQNSDVHAVLLGGEG